jgi:hypothetical protein
MLNITDVLNHLQLLIGVEDEEEAHGSPAESEVFHGNQQRYQTPKQNVYKLENN